MGKDDRWISFGGRRQKISSLPPELRKKLGIEDVVEEVKVVKKERMKEYGEDIKKDDNIILKGIDAVFKIIWNWLGEKGK